MIDEQPKPVEVVCALLSQQGAVLMGERKPHKVYPLHWEFPGGKIEPGEAPEAALVRELREELGLTLTQWSEYLREVSTYSNGVTYDVRYYRVHGWTGEIVDTEFHRTGWFTLPELEDLLHLSGNARILERLRIDGIPA